MREISAVPGSRPAPGELLHCTPSGSSVSGVKKCKLHICSTATVGAIIYENRFKDVDQHRMHQF